MQRHRVAKHGRGPRRHSGFPQHLRDGRGSGGATQGEQFVRGKLRQESDDQKVPNRIADPQSVALFDLYVLGPKIFFVTGLVMFVTAIARLVCLDLLG